MKYLFLIISLLLCPTAYADSYDLSPTPVDDVDIITIEIVEDEGTPEEHSILTITTLDDIKEVIDGTKEHIQYWHDVYLYLFSTAGVGLAGFLSRVGYLFYQTKTGKLLVKHVKNDAEHISDDIIDSIDSLTQIESGEVLRGYLKNIKNQLLAIAKEKLPPKP